MIKISFFENIGPNYLWRVRLLPVLHVNQKKVYYPPFNIFLHIFKTSDHDRALHDHPWPSVSFKLWGAVSEIYWEPIYTGSLTGVQRERYVPWLLPVFRKATHRHRLVLNGTFGVTIFCVGFKQRSWGFWPKGQYVPWREYLGLEDDAHVD